jgi:D-3-phosphoglycerate dehydrogenase
VDTAWTISRRVKRANDIAEVFSTCDFITVHVPLMENTHHLVGEAELAKMKPTTKLFNFSRKEIVDTDAVLRALKADRLAGYTTDFADEQLLHNEKVLVLPHLGASTEEAEVNCAKMAARTLKKFLEFGTIKRSVNFPTVEMAFHSPYRLTIINRNVPNMLGQISSIIAESGINIDNMLNRGREDFAYTLADVASEDEALLNQLADKLRENENIVRVRVIKNQEVGY